LFIKDIKRWVEARPFEPFAMVLTDGQRIVVRHPENCFYGPNSVHVVYAKNRNIQGFSNVSLYHISRIEPVNGHSGNGTHKRRRKKA
jgi:hypothetical protein